MFDSLKKIFQKKKPIKVFFLGIINAEKEEYELEGFELTYLDDFLKALLFKNIFKIKFFLYMNNTLMLVY